MADRGHPHGVSVVKAVAVALVFSRPPALIAWSVRSSCRRPGAEQHSGDHDAPCSMKSLAGPMSRLQPNGLHDVASAPTRSSPPRLPDLVPNRNHRRVS